MVAEIDQSKIKNYLQDVEVSIQLGQSSSVASAEAHDIPVPEALPVGMLVAVRPTKGYKEKFWLAAVTSTRSEEPLVHNIRYYQQSSKSTCWKLMRGTGAYGYVPHNAVIAAGIELNSDGQMRASSKRLIEKKIQKE